MQDLQDDDAGVACDTGTTEGGKERWPLPEGGEIAGEGQQRVANAWIPLRGSCEPQAQQRVQPGADAQHTSGQVLF